MKKYEVDITINGITSAIDNIEAAADYTADQYIEDCRRNADQEWIDMIESGMITLVTEENEEEMEEETMMTMNAETKANGELAVRSMSEKAQEGYNGTDPLAVYEQDGRFIIKDADGVHDGMTFDEVQDYLESFAFEEADA